MSVDVLVIGAGHNGLAAAAWLAQHGKKVVVCEARDDAGGLAAGAEFHPGYRHVGILHDTATVRPWVVDRLGLDLALRDPAPVYGPAGDVLLHPDPGRAEVGDPGGYAAWRAFVDRIRAFATSVLDASPPDLGVDASLWPLARRALGLRRLGRDDMLELLRVGPLSMRDHLAEHLDDPVAAAMLMAPPLVGAWMGPRSPLGAANLLLREALAGREVEGGPAALVAALQARCTALGVTLRMPAPVRRVLVVEGAVQGVELADDTTLYAPAVLSAVGPRRTLLDLVEPLHLPATVDAEVRKVRVRGTIAKVHLALSGPLELARRPGERFERLRLVSGPDHLERAFDDAKYGRLPTAPPPLDVLVPTVADPSLAPEGHHVASAIVYGVPAALEGGWTDAARQAVLGRVLETLGGHAPGLRDLVVAHEVLAPADLEDRYGAEGGHPWHGEHALDQLWALRPTPRLARYATPIDGLWLGSMGCHPGGGITGGPGALAAQALLAAG